jgi:hypothetical protein
MQIYIFVGCVILLVTGAFLADVSARGHQQSEERCQVS